MKKLIFLTLTFCLLAFSNVFGQITDDTNITVSATVDAALTVERIQDLQFGDIEQGTTADIVLDNDNSPNEEVFQQIGRFSVSALDGRNIEIIVPDEVTLTEFDDENKTLSYKPLVYQNENTRAEGGVESTAFSFAEINDEFDVGGTLEAPTGGFEVGAYSGDVTITVNYY